MLRAFMVLLLVAAPCLGQSYNPGQRYTPGPRYKSIPPKPKAVEPATTATVADATKPFKPATIGPSGAGWSRPLPSPVASVPISAPPVDTRKPWEREVDEKVQRDFDAMMRGIVASTEIARRQRMEEYQERLFWAHAMDRAFNPRMLPRPEDQRVFIYEQ